jgi:alcohol dehydrogenase class IV
MLVGWRFHRGIGALLVQFGFSRPLVGDRSLDGVFGTVERLLAPLAAMQAWPRRCSATRARPTDTVIRRGGVLSGRKLRRVLGFGGGSPMDTAKAMAILAAAAPGRRCAPSRRPWPPTARRCPVICVPTTAGTGSEATRFTVITDVENDEKMLIAGLGALPLAAIVDHELTFSVPRRTTADTGIDSLTHALEAFVSRRANAVSDMYARRRCASSVPTCGGSTRRPTTRRRARR